jgi:hypothetical protein
MSKTQLKKNLKGISMVMLICMAAGCSTLALSRKQGINDPAFLGNWSASSSVYMATPGDMVVTRDKIDFVKKGSVSFEVVASDGKEYILKMDGVVDTGLFMRIGPIVSSKDGKKLEMEVAHYESEAKALAKRKERHDNASSWGVYERLKNIIK